MDRLGVMYGGGYSDKLYDELWQYNLYTNMWTKLRGKFGESSPKSSKNHIMVTYSDVIYNM